MTKRFDGGEAQPKERVEVSMGSAEADQGVAAFFEQSRETWEQEQENMTV